MAAKQQRVRALRNFWHAQKQIGIGSVLDVDIGLANELRSGLKAEAVQADTPLVDNAPQPKPPRAKSETETLLSTLVDLVKNQGSQLEALTAALQGLAEGKRIKG